MHFKQTSKPIWKIQLTQNENGEKGYQKANYGRKLNGE